uniref:Uncharacterized protein n=1 Tax=Sphaerodactylus townsendi TaxID=933632 RepID=A0ACB8F0T9_9SAUR
MASLSENPGPKSETASCWSTTQQQQFAEQAPGAESPGAAARAAHHPQQHGRPCASAVPLAASRSALGWEVPPRGSCRALMGAVSSLAGCTPNLHQGAVPRALAYEGRRPKLQYRL